MKVNVFASDILIFRASRGGGGGGDEDDDDFVYISHVISSPKSKF